MRLSVCKIMSKLFYSAFKLHNVHFKKIFFIDVVYTEAKTPSLRLLIKIIYRCFLQNNYVTLGVQLKWNVKIENIKL